MNINMLMQQAQRMQKDMEQNVKKAKEQLAQTEVQAEAGGGLVKVTMTCRNVVKRIEINPELLQDEATPDNLMQACIRALEDREYITDLKQKFTQLHYSLRQDTAAKAAEVILKLAK